MKKSILALLLVLALAFTFVGCGNDTNSADVESAVAYEEKCNKSTDISVISDVISYSHSMAADAEYMDDILPGFKFTITLSKGKCVLSSDSKRITDEWANMTDLKSGYTLKSKDFSKVSNTYTGVVESNGSVTWTADSTDTLIQFSKDFSSKFSK